MEKSTNLPLLELAFNDSDWDEFLFVVSDYTNTDHWFEPTTETILVTAYSVIILLGILTNVIFIAVIVKTKKVLKTRNLLFMNLAVSDLVMCGFCIPFTVVKLTRKSWSLGEALCRLIPMLQAVDVFIFSFTIIAISCDRYSAIVHATENLKRVSSMMPALIVIWISSFGLAVPIAIFSTVVKAEYLGNVVSYQICMEHWPSAMSRALYTLVSTLIQFAVPLAIMIPLHTKICRFLKSRMQYQSQSPVDAERMAKKEARYRSTMKLLTAVVLAFLLSWVPLSVVNIMADFNYTIFTRINFNALYVTCHMIAMASVFVNPLLYGWFNTNFQRQLRGILFSGSKELSEKDGLLNTSAFKGSSVNKIKSAITN